MITPEQREQHRAELRQRALRRQQQRTLREQREQHWWWRWWWACQEWGQELWQKWVPSSLRLGSSHYIENPRQRFTWLVFSAVAGFVVYQYCIPIVEYVVGEIPNPLRQLPATLPTLALLWRFRTYDTRQQIVQEKEQIQQNYLTEGLRLLMTDDPLKITVGAEFLIEVSKQIRDDKFDAQVRIAFVNRLQHLPRLVHKDSTQEKLGNAPVPVCISVKDARIPYALKIFEWLWFNLDVDETIKLTFQNFSCEEFPAKAGEEFEISGENIGWALGLDDIH